MPVIQIPSAPPLPAKPVPSGIAEVLKARFPLSIGFADLGAGWRVFDYGGLYFTRGDTQFLNGQEYVVAYKRIFANPADLSPAQYALFATRNVYHATKDDRYKITLFPAETLQRLVTNGQTEVRSFDANDFKVTAALPTSDAFRQNLSLVYLRKIREAVSAYSRANLGVLPPLDSSAGVGRELDEFAENPAIFTQPGTTRPFAFNPLFSARKVAHLKGKGVLVLAFEAEPASDGSRAILTYGGSVARLNRKQWTRLFEASQLG